MDVVDKSLMTYAVIFFVFVTMMGSGAAYFGERKREQLHRHEMDRLHCKEAK
jgi:hypothetical protein